MDDAKPAPVLLTERMRTHTRTVHDKSDKAVNLKLGLVLTSRPLYGEAIALFAPIYRRIEKILSQQKSHSQLGKLQPFLPTLCRGAGFEADMQFYLNEEQLAAIKARQARGEPPELAAYLARLDELEKNDPILLLAYAYHMYMAIFAGGFQIRRMVTKAMGLTRGQEAGVQIFCFEDLGPSTTGFRNDYKNVINTEISLTEDEIERLLEESGRVFEQNNALVATVQDSEAFATASAACTAWVLKVVGATLVALGAQYAYRHREALLLFLPRR